MTDDPGWIGTDELPAAFAELDPPVDGLWYLGRNPESYRHLVAIVGARRATRYGIDIAFGLGADLAARGVCVVSGLALGCDAAAHRGAVSVRGPTLAVLAGGVDVPYPASNAGLYGRILSSGGTIVSEEPSGTSATKGHFKRRNRIIAAFGEVLIVVQGRAEASGAKGTVEYAAALGKTTMGVPGDVRSALSSLPHELIFDGGPICRTSDDVLQHLKIDRGDVGIRVPDHIVGAPRDVAMGLVDGPAPAEVVAARAGLPAGSVLAVLSSLEIAGIVERAGPNYRLKPTIIH